MRAETVFCRKRNGHDWEAVKDSALAEKEVEQLPLIFEMRRNDLLLDEESAAIEQAKANRWLLQMTTYRSRKVKIAQGNRSQ